MRRAARRPMGITTPSGIEALLSGATFSASQIEAYLRCPYRWFYEMVLAPVELDREYEARDEGAFAHRLLASVYREVSEQGSGGLDQAALPDALSALQDAYEMECARQGDPASVREMAGRRKALQWVRRIVTEDAARDDGFHPAFIEQEFGSEKLVSIGDFELRGRIDRVDVDAGGRAVVIDYKRTCRPRHSAGKLLEEGSVQLPLYLEAVRQALGLTPVAGVYRGLAEAGERGLVVEGALPPDRTKKKDMLAGADFDALVEQALELAQAAVAGMRAGDTSPAPRTATACTSCPVRPSCGRRS